MLGADLLQDLRLLLAAHDVDQPDAVLEADLVEHLAEVGGGRRVHQRLVVLAAHGLDHAQRGQRIDEPGRAVGRRRAGRQAHDVAHLHGAVLRIHRAADDRRPSCPSAPCAASEPPALTTTPAPSLPIGSD